jgi:hypothetical protein
MAEFNENHPEKKPHETFITNASLDGFNRIIFKTKRLGLVAYMIGGENMGSSIFFPVFASSKEVEKEMKNQRCTDFNELDVFEEIKKSSSRLIL